MNVKLAVGLMLALALVTACGSGHTTLAEARTGAVGDRVDLAAGVVSSAPEEVLRELEQNLLRFDVCDRDGTCMRVEMIASGSQRERAAEGTWVPVGQFIEVRGGRLMEDGGRLFIRANIVSHIAPPADWPE